MALAVCGVYLDGVPRDPYDGERPGLSPGAQRVVLVVILVVLVVLALLLLA